jgi:hypothetical protein
VLFVEKPKKVLTIKSAGVTINFGLEDYNSYFIIPNNSNRRLAAFGLDGFYSVL